MTVVAQVAAKVDVRVDDVVLAVLDDGKANAVDRSVARDLRAALAIAVSSEFPLVIAGRSGIFSAGFDLAIVRSDDPSALPDLLEETRQLLMELVAAPVPVVVACTGHALAAGALLLLAADHRIGPTGEARIGLNEVALGMALPGMALSLAASRLSPVHLHRATVLGRSWSPAEAVTVGFLDELDEDPLAAALGTAQALARLDRVAFRVTKQLAGRPLLTRLRDQTLVAPGAPASAAARPEARR